MASHRFLRIGGEGS